MGSVQQISGVVTQGRSDAPEWVTRYTVVVSSDGNAWEEVDSGKVFIANADQNTKVENIFTAPPHARWLRIVVEAWRSDPSMRAAVLIPDNQRTSLQALGSVEPSFLPCPPD